jgi:hypothetical protein
MGYIEYLTVHELTRIMKSRARESRYLVARFRRVRKNCGKRLLASSCLSVRPYLCSHGTVRLSLKGFSLTLIFEDFSKICRETSSFVRIKYMYICSVNVSLFTILICDCFVYYTYGWHLCVLGILMPVLFYLLIFKHFHGNSSSNKNVDRKFIIYFLVILQKLLRNLNTTWIFVATVRVY